jgi:DNA-binding transcriptional MerR regulator
VKIVIDKTELFTPGTAAKMVGVDAELLKVWTTEFNIQTERTPGGHRRYSKENIATLIEIRKKIREQNWSYDQVRAWLNGSIDAFEPQQQSEIEKKMDKLFELMQQQQQFNLALAQKLDELRRQNEELLQLNRKLREENQALKGFIGERDQHLIESLKQTMQERKSQKRTGILARLFTTKV